MAKAPKFSKVLKNTLLNSGMDSVFNSGELVLMYGTKPTDAEGALDANNVLAVISLPADAFAAASGGEKAKTGTWEVNAANGAKLQSVSPSTCSWFRIRTTGDDNAAGAPDSAYARLDGTVGVVGSQSDLDMNTNVLALNDRIVIDTFKVSVP